MVQLLVNCQNHSDLKVTFASHLYMAFYIFPSHDCTPNAEVGSALAQIL